MEANGLVVMPGMGPAWKMTPGRSSTLKLRNDETEESVMMFEEVAPIGTVTPMHLHHDSDEVAYVLSGEITFKIGDTVTVGGPVPAPSCRVMLRMRGRAPAPRQAACCFYTRPEGPGGCSRRWSNGRWTR